MQYEDLLLEDLNCANEERRSQLINAAVAFYTEMKAQMESGDPAKREDAMKRMKEVQALLTARRNALCEKTGLTPHQMAVISRHPRFQKGHAAVAEAKEKLEMALNPPKPKIKRKDRRVPV